MSGCLGVGDPTRGQEVELDAAGGGTRVIVRLLFDRTPKKEVKFTRHNSFERDRCMCQYCGGVFDRMLFLPINGRRIR